MCFGVALPPLKCLRVKALDSGQNQTLTALAGLPQGSPGIYSLQWSSSGSVYDACTMSVMTCALFDKFKGKQ